MITSLEFYSYLLAAVAMTLLLVLLLAASQRRQHHTLLILTCLITVVWALLSALQEVVTVPVLLTATFEWLRYVSWIYFFIRLMHHETDQSFNAKNPWIVFAALLTAAGSTVPHLVPWRLSAAADQIPLATFILLTILGLGIIEQIIRNSSPEQRWAKKFLCVAIGSILAYDFYMYSEALLVREVNPHLWLARGIVNALVVPLIAVSAARHTNLSFGIHVSRHVVFHSATVIGAGCYLLLMAAMGYYIRYIGGTWGGLFQILFLFGAALLLMALLFSNKLRLNLKVLLSKHFYNYKYDYRQQWLAFTHHLANTTGTVPERSCRAIAELVHGSGALLWCKNLHQNYELLCHWNMPDPDISSDQLQQDLASIDLFLQKSLWVIDFEEYTRTPERYEDLSLPPWMLAIPRAWLIVPLILQNQILGFILLKRSDISTPVNWEDRDLLKMAAQQAAIHLAQYRSEIALIEARQFEAYNRLSTYVMHDLKNILAQQSLIISNAERHRHKTEFVDDVLRTVANSVDRMTRLLAQMKRGDRNESSQQFLLLPLIEEAIAANSARLPKPALIASAANATTVADREQLKTVLSHIIQNAQEATPADGIIEVQVQDFPQSTTITVTDTGQGMEPDFIKEKLFKPFESTKGLMGMGIGAYESRQYILSLGGDIRAYSEYGKGSQFKITLPHPPFLVADKNLHSETDSADTRRHLDTGSAAPTVSKGATKASRPPYENMDLTPKGATFERK